MEMPLDAPNGHPKADFLSHLDSNAAQQPDSKPDDVRPPSPTSDALVSDTTREDPATLVRKLLKGKEQEWTAAVSRKQGKLTLLELPLDILRLIVAEITHTNDLSSLALTNSTLYNLAISHIYSRFDIVWPDATQLTQSDSKNVDALTYGLSTLCLGNSFAYRAQKMFAPRRSAGGKALRRLRNDHASYIKKFSLGNGPDDWVSEYMINKESGKMLGTLVAIAVSKMVNLETFVWDMPTGVLADIFMALASVGDLRPEGESKLDRVWVRWHDNSEGSNPSTAPTPPPEAHSLAPLGSTVTSIGILVPSTVTHPPAPPRLSFAEARVEFPTFSVLPPLKSLSVLDVDELAYLDEMAMAIETSKDKLEELRVGISSKATRKDFIQSWDGPGLQQVDSEARWPGENNVGDRRLGGVLGILVGRIFDIRKKQAKSKEADSIADSAQSPMLPSAQPQTESSTTAASGDGESMEGQQTASPANQINADISQQQLPSPEVEVSRRTVIRRPSDGQDGAVAETEKKRLDFKLRLKTLELERVPLSVHVCVKAFDWTLLTNLTILECTHHEALWKALRRHFQPTHSQGQGHSRLSSNLPQYHLALKKIHTDRASGALIHFLKETLAPNSLEILFLQERRTSGPLQVTIEQIFKGPIKRHRSSLQKILLDSSEQRTSSANLPESYRWLSWTATSEMILYITSGRMRNLKELSVCLHYADWHTFLQRLPNIPQLRSLHLPKIADQSSEPKELALQIVDIITLRPEIQLCYVGIAKKCFEILEVKQTDSPSHSLASSHVEHGVTQHSGVDEEEDGSDDDGSNVDTSDDEADEAQDMEDDDDDDDDDEALATGEMGDETEDSIGDTASEVDSFQEADIANGASRLRLREILFYDDRVAIFKARHGRL